MAYQHQLPPVHQLLRLARQVRFPAKQNEIVKVARVIETDRSVIEFLRLFPRDEVFKSRVEFMTRCEELELLINEERLAPVELLRSSQD